MTEKQRRKAIPILHDLSWEAIEPLRVADSYGVSARRPGSEVAEEFWHPEEFANRVLHGWSEG